MTTRTGTACTHLDSIEDIRPASQGCQECLAMGDTWVHLRLCLSCGHVGCCDSSSERHASKHQMATDHVVMATVEPEENWAFCYLDETTMRPARPPATSPARAQ